MLEQVFKVIRERLMIIHETPYSRNIVDEITVVNTSDQLLRNIFLYRMKFMPGLRILDESDTELVVYPNEYTKSLFRERAKQDTEHEELLKKIESHEIYVLWIRFPHDRPAHPNEPKIIKLIYHDEETPLPIPFRESLTESKFLFSIPRFMIQKSTPLGENYDTFVVIKVPEGYSLDYNFVKKHKIVENDNVELTRETDRYYEDLSEHIISIRIPPLKQRIEFEMTYDVAVENNERWFFGLAVFSLIGVSTLLSLISTKVIAHDSIIILQPIAEHMNTIFGGLITAALAALGFMKNPSTNRTRFYFLIPIIISAVGFLLQQK